MDAKESFCASLAEFGAKLGCGLALDPSGVCNFTVDGEVEVVVEALFGGGSDVDLHVFENVHHGARYKMRRRVPAVFQWYFVHYHGYP